MTSTTEHTPPTPLKGKLNHVKNLLEDANKRLYKEAAKYEIFTTKTSASGAPTTAQLPKQNGNSSASHSNGVRSEVPKDLHRTLTDISTIQSVLSCPIFSQIVNVTDSLDQLSYHLNLRPSIGPVDISIDSNGELILAPPIEPVSLNNLINSRLDEFSRHSQSSSPQVMDAQDLVHVNNEANNSHAATAAVNGMVVYNNGPTSFMSAEMEPTGNHMSGAILYEDRDQSQVTRSKANRHNISNVVTNNYVRTNDYAQEDDIANNENVIAQSYKLTHDEPSEPSSFLSQTNSSLSTISPVQQHLHHQQQHQQTQLQQQQQHQQSQLPHQQLSREYDTEKLVANRGDANYVNGGRRRRNPEQSKVQSVAAVFESAIAESSENRRLYKANGNLALNQMSPTPTGCEVETNSRSMGQKDDRSRPSSNNMNYPQTLGYSNEMYKAAHEVAQGDGINSIDYHKLSMEQTDQDKNAYANNITPMVVEAKVKHQSSSRNGVQRVQNQRASPSTSAGSTVRLADECDSGTSSFRSQAAKSTLYSPQSHKPIAQLDEDPTDSSMDQELIEKLSPEMERIKVTLEKDSAGLGITIAGYTCEQEEISGIFIKSITPGSPADRSGKIRILDQIFAVNGQEILGYSNPEATNVLRRHTGRVVTLELMRYLAESKYKKLQTLLGHAEPIASVQAARSRAVSHHVPSVEPKSMGTNRQTVFDRSPIAANNNHNDLIMARPGVASASSPRQATYQPRTAGLEGRIQQIPESLYSNTGYPETKDSVSQSNNNETHLPRETPSEGCTPVAAQRGATLNKVIETKQGARNKIDIRSPMCRGDSTSAPMSGVARVASSSYSTNPESSAFQSSTNDVTASSVANSNSSSGATSRSIAERLKQEAAEEFGHLVRSERLEWESGVQIIELSRDSSQSLGFTVKDYANPKDPQQSIFMIVHLSSGGIAEQDGRLSVGDLLVFVDDTNLEGASPNEAVRALRRASGQVRLGVLKYKRSF